MSQPEVFYYSHMYNEHDSKEWEWMGILWDLKVKYCKKWVVKSLMIPSAQSNKNNGVKW